jgi:hypothetical protein
MLTLGLLTGIFFKLKKTKAMKTSNEQDVKNHPDDVRQDIVEITVDNETRKIHRGRRTVAEIKTAGQVPLAYTLVQIEDGQLVPLPDDGSVVIKGGEQFKSHPKDGGNS